ncbi:arsenate reductase ArsC [Herbivorax sp. ANBcel31]|uniref:arsenate reductase ArsC n=1 Tax=Herbivorax sp. ANBcel31 TaxID=3069754 RepID=UPI0027B30772|nr:arsenate reductase ArsC [Herbivorax sp. ANBcel31]MDQ2086764.1 arsenate reductase ArsC [Herbivorax sp. ANBcel31]
MNKIRVLFLCVHNSARSQIAEAYMNKYGSDFFEAESAGFDPKEINPLAITVMKEEGIDISKNSIDNVFDFFKQQKFFGYIVTVCEESTNQKCPIFPGVLKRIHWDLEDPNNFSGTNEEKLEKMRTLRDIIKNKVLIFIRELEQNYKK